MISESNFLEKINRSTLFEVLGLGPTICSCGESELFKYTHKVYLNNILLTDL